MRIFFMLINQHFSDSFTMEIKNPIFTCPDKCNVVNDTLKIQKLTTQIKAAGG